MSVRSQRRGALSPAANQLFDPSAVNLLLRPQDWRLVSTQAPPDVAPAKRVPAKRALWSRRHAHARASLSPLKPAAPVRDRHLAGRT